MKIKRPKKYVENTRIKKRPLVFYDLEFSGLEIHNEIIEIGCVLVSQPEFEVVKEWSVKVMPRHLATADKNSLKLLGFSDSKWKKAVSLRQALTEFNNLARGAVLVGYNSSWDFLFLKKSYAELEMKPAFHWQMLDVLSMAFAKLYGTKIKGFRMTEVVRYFHIEHGVWHKALDDARATYKLFLKIMHYEKRK